ncbi:MAG: hypothetical protein HKL82_00120 [Acidimicrobiaceae bacterium]|nr:hypothetical protein [Acidimicrobiaceae bacterium]
MSNLAIHALQFSLDGLSIQQKAIANDVANVNTPGFTGTTVSFESSLQQALSATTPTASATITVGPSSNTPSSNGNNVSFNQELVQMEQTTMQYQAVVGELNNQFHLIAGSAGGTF